MTDTILVLDEGTTSTRAVLFDPHGRALRTVQAELTQHYPGPGRVEHDASEIWDKTLACAREAVADDAGSIAAIGIANQRETVVAWDGKSGEPLAPAIVWQDRRSAADCARLKEAGHEKAVQRATGLLLDPYFSATKMAWLLRENEAVRGAADAGTLMLGTVDSWLAYKLTGAHLTDASNASRTSLLPLDGAGFDEGLCELFGVPSDTLPRVVDTHGRLGEAAPEWFGRPIPLCAMLGDQQAATIGQACLAAGDTKATYGTGAFVLTNRGHAVPRSANRLLSTVLTQSNGERSYALEGSIFVAGSLIQWLRDSLGMLDSAQETETLARSVADSGGVTIVPALAGLGAPHWLPEARAAITGLTFATGKAEIARAALEAMAHQTCDLASAFERDGARWTGLAVDGGMSANDWMVQDVADMLDLEVARPAYVETTALGAAMAAAAGAGLYAGLEQAAAAMGSERTVFRPKMEKPLRDRRLAAWRRALIAVQTAN